MKGRKFLSLSLFLCIGACLFQSPKMDILDLSIISDTPNYIEGIKYENNKIRGIIEYKDITDGDMYRSVVAPRTLILLMSRYFLLL